MILTNYPLYSDDWIQGSQESQHHGQQRIYCQRLVCDQTLLYHGELQLCDTATAHRQISTCHVSYYTFSLILLDQARILRWVATVKENVRASLCTILAWSLNENHMSSHTTFGASVFNANKYGHRTWWWWWELQSMSLKFKPTIRMFIRSLT